MVLDRRHTNALLSILLIALWTVIVLLIAYPSHNAPTDTFGLVIYCIITLFFGLGAGVAVLLARLLKLMKNPDSFFYNFVGTLNVCLGVLGLVLTIQGDLDTNWIYLFAISFLIGLGISADIYLSKDIKA